MPAFLAPRLQYHIARGAGPEPEGPAPRRAMTQKPSLTYRDAGVDIDAGEELVERIKPHVKRTRRPEVMGGLGGFGALVELPPGRWQRPVLVSGTDGVGTKLRLALDTGSTETVINPWVVDERGFRDRA